MRDKVSKIFRWIQQMYKSKVKYYSNNNSTLFLRGKAYLDLYPLGGVDEVTVF